MNKTRPKVLAIIPARKGSKRLPGKNHKKFNGKSLIKWTIESAINSKYISHTVLSSNDEVVLQIGSSYKEIFCLHRSEELSGDHILSTEVVSDVLDSFGDFDYFILLQPTSPLRNHHHIDKALLTTFQNNAKSCVSLCESYESPYLMYKISSSGNLKPILQNNKILNMRTQDMPITYVLNGAIYINEINDFIKKKKFITQDSIGFIMDSDSSIDIDTIEDFKLAEKITSKILN